ncbi:hypothetical protein V8F20_004331 [Naviculisporaceae sp. PSN 640]
MVSIGGDQVRGGIWTPNLPCRRGRRRRFSFRPPYREYLLHPPTGSLGNIRASEASVGDCEDKDGVYLPAGTAPRLVCASQRNEMPDAGVDGTWTCTLLLPTPQTHVGMTERGYYGHWNLNNSREIIAVRWVGNKTGQEMILLWKSKSSLRVAKNDCVLASDMDSLLLGIVRRLVPCLVAANTWSHLHEGFGSLVEKMVKRKNLTGWVDLRAVNYGYLPAVDQPEVLSVDDPYSLHESAVLGPGCRLSDNDR